MIVVYTDASNYAHEAYLCQERVHGVTTEESIRFLGGTFHCPQTRWSTIEMEAYAIYWALLRLDDLIEGIPFTIRTHHRNLLFMNQHGSRKGLHWKLDIQHYNAVIEHVPGKRNTPADISAGKSSGINHYLFCTSLPYTVPQNNENLFTNICPFWRRTYYCSHNTNPS